MMNFVLDIENNVWQLAGWTMIHFAWIGTALLALVFLTRLTLRRAHPTWRYATTLLLFTALALSPLAIAGWLVAHWPATPVVAQVETPPEATPAPSLPPVVFEPPATEIIELTQLDDAQLEALAPASEQPPIIELTELPQFNEETTPQFLAPAPTEPATLPQNPIATTSSSAISVGFVVSSTPAEQFIAALDRASQYLPWFWLIGAPLTFALLATGLVGGERLRRGAELLTTGPIVEACEQLKRQLKITRRVVIAATDRVAQPVLVGIVRPMILLPWAALHGWRADQIEMVLLHELAHVRRWDNLVNLGQRIVESLLFYHPAVWLVSRWLRHDREECCDAVVVAHTGEPAEYAELLISVAAQLKSRRMPLAASAMAQHPLARRVRRLLQLEEDPMLVSRTSLLMGVAALVVAAVVAANYPLLAEDERPPAEGNAPAASVADEPADTPSRLWPIPYDVYAQEVEKAGRLVEPGEVIATLNEKLANEAAESNSPFLSLEDQRVADLAYNMLGVEVEPLTEELPPEGRERGFKGGVKVVQFDSQGFNQRRNLVFMEGDILVGLHVWPINDFDSLGEVLRRDDLEQYSPLKVYMLRPRSAGRSVRAARGEEAGSESESEIGGFELVTGRMSFDSAAWSKEQARLGNRSDVPRRQSSAGRRVAPGQAPPSERPIPGTDIVVIEGTKEGVEARVEEKLSQLRYDGRSFDEWRSQWRNELKVEERIEAIKAMTAFGRAGYGREAAEAIFDVAAQYDFRATSTTSPESGLVKAIRSAFSNYRGSGSVGTSGGAIAIDVWMNVLSERLESDRETYLPIAVSLLPHAQLEESVLSLVEKWSKSEDENLRRAAFAAYFRSASSDKPYVEEAFRRALVHEDRQLAFMALSYLISRTNVGPPGSPQIQPTVERLYPEVLEILFHPEKIMRPHARWLIAHVDDKLARRFAADLVKRLEGTYGYAETTDTRIAALRALGALGPRAQAAMKSLKDPKRLFDGPDLATRAALATALYQILGPEAAGDRQEMGEIASIWDAMSEGLEEHDSERLAAKFMEDVTEIYPKGQIPPTAEAVFKYFEAELEKADVPPPSEPPPAEPRYAPPPPSPDVQKKPEPATEIAESPEKAEAASGTPLDRLRYKGMSFEQWRTQWRNELDVEQRIEAVKAIAVFGRAGHNREAAEAILEVAAQYNRTTTDRKSPEDRLVNVIKSVFESRRQKGGIPTSTWMSVLKDQVERDPATYKPVVMELVPDVPLDDATQPIIEEWSKSGDKELYVAAFAAYVRHAEGDVPELDGVLRRALAHKDGQVAAFTIRSMVRYEHPQGSPYVTVALPVAERLYPEIMETLFHREPEVRQITRWLIASTDDKLARRFAEDLVKRLEESKGNSPEATDTRIAAIRALGALGTRAADPMESLKGPKGMLESTDLPTRAALGVAILQMVAPDKLVEEAPSIVSDLKEGLDPDAIKSLSAALIAEEKEIYPQGRVPQSVREVFSQFKEVHAEPDDEAKPD